MCPEQTQCPKYLFTKHVKENQNNKLLENILLIHINNKCSFQALKTKYIQTYLDYKTCQCLLRKKTYN